MEKTFSILIFSYLFGHKFWKTIYVEKQAREK